MLKFSSPWNRVYRENRVYRVLRDMIKIELGLGLIRKTGFIGFGEDVETFKSLE